MSTPVNSSERIFTLDMLRGVAILGILLMNIPFFAMPYQAAYDPSLLGEQGTINFSAWYVVEWIFEGTQRALFSTLFGAGIILFVTRQEMKSTGLAPADYFFRRQLWLMVFSLFDVYILLWNGDILFDYACIGMILFTIRSWNPKKLLIAAGVCILLMTARENRDLYSRKGMIERGEIIEKIDTIKTPLTAVQKSQLEEMTAFRSRFSHDKKMKVFNEEKEKMTRNYASVYEARTDSYMEGIIHFLYLRPWDIFTFMLIGMAFFKLGILTGSSPTKIYWLLCAVGLIVGLTISYFHVQNLIDSDWNGFRYAKDISFNFYELGRVTRALGILGLIMLLYKSNIFGFIFNALRFVGQMAFTNYLMQSLICGFIFNAYGLALYGSLPRVQIYAVVFIIWTFQIIFCNTWMRFFLYGPFEWAWRSLTYWRRQPFKR